VSSASVRLQVLGPSASEVLRTSTDATGRYAFGGIPPDRYGCRASVVAEHPDLGAGVVSFRPIGGAGDVEIHVFLREAVTIHGRISDSKGLPVAGARVTLDFAALGRGADMARRATTDGEGRYRFDAVARACLEPAGGRLFVRRPGVGVASVDVPVPQSSTLRVDATVLPGASIVGRLRDASGCPVAGAALRVRPIDAKEYRQRARITFRPVCGSHACFRAVSDDAGAFRFTALPVGQHGAAAYQVLWDVGRATGSSLPPLPDTVVSIHPDASSWVDIALPPSSGEVRVRVVDPEDAPVPGATVGAACGSWYGYSTTDKDGRCTVPLYGSAPSIDVECTSQRLGRLRHPDIHVPATRVLVLRYASGLEAIRGMVLDGTGTPVVGASVWTLDLAYGAHVDPVSGRFVLGVEGSGPRDLMVERQGETRVYRDVPVDSAVTLRWDEGDALVGSVAGRVRVAGARVDRVILLGDDASIREETATIRGVFRFDQVPMGRYMLLFRCRRDDVLLRPRFVLLTRGQPEALVDVRITAGDLGTVFGRVTPGEAGPVRFRLLPEDLPAPIASSGVVRTDSARAVPFVVEAGRYRLQAVGPSSLGFRLESTVCHGDGPNEIVARAVPAGRLVLAVERSPRAGVAWLDVIGPGGDVVRRHRLARTGARRELEEILPAGSYRVRGHGAERVVDIESGTTTRVAVRAGD